MPKITKKIKLMDLMYKHPEALEPIMKAGLHCMGCHAAAFETLEDGAKAHGLSDKEIDALVEEINKRGNKNAKTKSK
jgi:hybrid cluster-associated redox disulfide protein